MFLEVVLGIFKVALANGDAIFRVSSFVLGGYFFGVTTLDFCRLFLLLPAIILLGNDAVMSWVSALLSMCQKSSVGSYYITGA